jgi:hypothetical protein
VVLDAHADLLDAHADLLEEHADPPGGEAGGFTEINVISSTCAPCKKST